MKLTILDTILWAAGFLGHTVLLTVIFVRRRAGRARVFTALIAFNLFRSMALLAILARYGPSSSVYFYGYWSLVILDTAMQFAICYEIASWVFRPRGTWAIDIRDQLLFWVIGSVVMAAVLMMLVVPPDQPFLDRMIQMGGFSSAMLMTELFAGMVALSSIAGLDWKSHIARIAEGLAVYSFSSVILESANTVFGFHGQGNIYASMQEVRKVLYITCLAYWCIYLWRESPSTRTMTPRMSGNVDAIREALVKGTVGWGE